MQKRILLFLLFFVCTVLFFSCASVEKPQEDKPLTIHQIILNGQGSQIKDQFQTKVDVNLLDENGNTPLHAAAQINDADIAVFLIIRGANTEIKNAAGETPLFTAVKNKSYQTAAELVQMDADIFAVHSSGKNIAETAIAEGKPFFDAFITPKTGILRDRNGNSIIHYLVQANSLEGVENAVQKKLPLSVSNGAKKTPLDLALENNDNLPYIKIAAALVLGNAAPVYGDFAYFETAVKTRNPNMRFNDGQTPLQLAAKYNHSGIIEYFLERGSSVNAKDVSGATALHYAVRNGNIAVTQKLLNAGANPNSADSSGKTALLCIISPQNRLEMYDILLGAGANPNAKDMYGDTALHMATMLNAETDVLKKLTEAGADIDERNKKGATPLAAALETKNVSHTAFYTSHGANIHSEDLSGLTPLIRALKSEKELFAACVTDANISSRDSYGNTPLHVAVQQRTDGARLAILFDLGAEINARNRMGDTALYTAVEKNYREAGELLLSRDADVFGTNAKNYSPLHIALERGGITRDWLLASSVIGASDGVGNTPLHYAAIWKFEDSLNFLLQKGAKINARNANGETALFSAAQADSPVIVELLIKNGINQESRDFLGNTALHASARWGAEKSALTLIRNGADVNAQNLAGKTPLAEALRNGSLRMAVLYLDNGANPNTADAAGKTPLIDVIQIRHTDAIKLLLDRGAAVSIQDIYGRNAYHEAVLTADIPIIDLVAKAGGNPFSRDSHGKTPLSLALNSNASVITAVLNADKRAADSDGNTPLHIAVSEKTGAQTLNLLIGMGYPLNSRNRSGVTPLLQAIKAKDYQSALTLLSAGADTYLADTSGNSPMSLLLEEPPENLADFIRVIGAKTDISGDGILHYAARNAAELTITKLLSYGLDKSAVNISGETPRDIAARWQRPEAVNLLK